MAQQSRGESAQSLERGTRPEQPKRQQGSGILPTWESFPSADRRLLLQTVIQVARRRAPKGRRPAIPVERR
jgi:hypothetical protein